MASPTRVDPRRGQRIEERLARRGGALELLRLPSLVYGGVTRLRNAGYDRGWLPRERLDCAVVSVGNLTVGGSGKTPMVAWLARELARRGRRPGVLARGYRGGGARLNDEGRALARELPGVPQVQRADRAGGGRELVALGVDVVLLDDGFQHRRLARDLDLVLIDATRPWGLSAAPGGAAVRALLPRGLLRERPQSLARADALVLTRTEQADARALAALERELEALAPGAPILLSEHRPAGLRGPEGERPLAALRGLRVELVSGIAHPAAFEATARALGAEVAGVHAFPDHHAFVAADLAAARAGGGELLATTKDAPKLAALGLPFLALEVELALVRGAAVMEALLDALPRGPGPRERAALHAGLHG